MLLKKITILTVLLVVTTLTFDGCTQPKKVIVKTVYVHAKRPKLQTLDINTTGVTPLKLDYKVIK